MNRPLRLLAATALGLMAGCASSTSKAEREFIGTWYAQGQASSYTWKLDEGGNFGEGQGFVTPTTDDGEWRVDGGQLVVEKKDGKQKSEIRGNAKVVGRTLTVDRNGETIIFTKIN